MHDPAALSVPQPFVCNGISRPRGEAGIVIVSIRHYQVIETSRNLRTSPQIMRRCLIVGGDFIPGPVS